MKVSSEWNRRLWPVREPACARWCSPRVVSLPVTVPDACPGGTEVGAPSRQTLGIPWVGPGGTGTCARRPMLVVLRSGLWAMPGYAGKPRLSTLLALSNALGVDRTVLLPP